MMVAHPSWFCERCGDQKPCDCAPSDDPARTSRGPDEDAVGAAPDFTGVDSLRSASGPCDPIGEYPECGRGTCADCREDRVLYELDERERGYIRDGK